ncbi:ATP-binding cassette domain-containing protein [Clostridium sp. D2Q-11]|uniref:ABC transporter ATP-binding protein n=1 Tax=Anaeromonas frigoriresistens TaxID=2683708 RepID=A0A942UU01_9FIRM|nr:ATP-binding cassette domain-containing protein [Anaeromonas frigoriresistens]MBS4538558.1 ATP-binding cassette domain-containing protein [Anaeromonas frigoriresistens]
MLKTVNLNYNYEDGKVALKNINIDLNKGNKIGIVGGNGAGKTTLFLSLIGYLKPDKGEVIFNDKKIKYNKKSLRNLRREVGIVFQEADKQIFYSNTYDDIAFGLRNLGYDEEIIKRKVDIIINLLNIEEFKDKPVHFLSHGEKKRVAIAGVLALDCKIIFFDEPLAGLDPSMSDNMINTMNNIVREGKKTVVSSHDMDFIYEYCDYVYVLNKGKVIDEGIPSKIFLNENTLNKANLKEPWLVKIHKKLNMPLFKNEEELYNFKRENIKG